jgi:hypothetical protein
MNEPTALELARKQVVTHEMAHKEGPMEACGWKDCRVARALVEATEALDKADARLEGIFLHARRYTIEWVMESARQGHEAAAKTLARLARTAPGETKEDVND